MKYNSITAARDLEYMPLDKVFELADGSESLCHATGIEVCMGDVDDPADWWNVYEDAEGNLYYGR
jgi:hypothetical protein